MSFFNAGLGIYNSYYSNDKNWDKVSSPNPKYQPKRSEKIKNKRKNKKRR